MKNNHTFVDKHCTKSTFYAIKEPRGITLIALIVTIVVLLILAGITVANITGSENAIYKANEAKNEHEKTDIMERIQAAVLSSATIEGDFILEDVKSAITNSVSNATFLNNQFPLRIQVSQNEYIVDSEGQITSYIGKEFLKSTGTQYIDTNYYSNAETRVKIGFSYTSKNNDRWSNGLIFGSANTDQGRPGFSIGLTQDDKLFYRNSNNEAAFNSSFTINSNSIYYIDIYKNNIYINDNLYTSQMILLNNAQNNSSYLFARHHPDNGVYHGAYSKFKGKLYYCQIYEGNTLIRDYIPVVSLESSHENEPCLYDKVEGKFYYNQGTGTFETN